MVLRSLIHRPRVAVAALVVAVAAGVGVMAGGPASTPATAAPVTVSGLDAAGLAIPLKAPPRPTVQPVGRPVMYDTCSTVRAHLAQYAAKARARHAGGFSCVTVTSGTASKATAARTTSAHADASATPAATGSSLCTSINGNWMYQDRTDECVRNLIIGYTQWNNLEHTTVIGTSTFDINQDIILSTISNLFVENDTVSFAAATGEGESGEITFEPTCTAPCQVVTAPISFPLALGQTDSFPFTYEDAAPTGGSNTTTISYSMPFLPSIPNIVEQGVATWGNNAPIRCDNAINPGSNPPGCVFPGYTPTLHLSTATYGAAAVNVAIGEGYVLGHPGQATPLHRGLSSLTGVNSDAICDSTFVRDDTLVANDSCDEYPFASTLESGAALGQTGANCLEALPWQLPDGSWRVEFRNDYTGTQVCERGHVPTADNNAVGGALSNLYDVDRLLVGDAFYVEVDD